MVNIMLIKNENNKNLNLHFNHEQVLNFKNTQKLVNYCRCGIPLTTTTMFTETLLEQTQSARQASQLLATTSTEQKDALLQKLADVLRQHQSKILEENQKDMAVAQQMLQNGELSESAYRRMLLSPSKVEQMATSVEAVAQLPDPVGQVELGTRLDDGLDLFRVSTPIGVILVIFESRPDALVQISSLSLKSGNAVILKGGREVQNTNVILTALIRETLENMRLPLGAVNLVETREEVAQLVQMSEQLDLIIPRGGNALVQHIQKHAQVPVLGHADGICHVFVDEGADPEMALNVVVDAKTDYPAVCNAVETLLLHRDHLVGSAQNMLVALHQAGVELRVCEETQDRFCDGLDLPTLAATAEDWVTEYTDLILSVKTVPDLEAAIEHINTCSSHHTDAIVTEHSGNAQEFLQRVDSAGVFWNASTRFADGFRYGFGAEVGVSTCRTHARGPVGMEGLVIHKYLLYGSGQGAGDYGVGKKAFCHTPLPQTLPEQHS